MNKFRVLESAEAGVSPTHQFDARELARRLPALGVMARQVAATVAHGVHGRRKAGVGESFWQFRPYSSGESTLRIDWRRSARDHRVYIKEREQEAAQTYWIWIDRSRSMAFQSSLSRQAKIDRALVLALAAADLLVRGGERVGLLGICRPMASRDIIGRFSEMLMQDLFRGGLEDSLPKSEPLSARSRAILIGDFLSPATSLGDCISRLAAQGASGSLVTIRDPAEETFPFVGHTELRDVETGEKTRFRRVESVRGDYIRRLEAHQEAVRAAAAAVGWGVLIHRTDRSASEALLALRMRLEGAA